MSHTCHAHGCEKPVPPRMLFCAPHWRQVRPALRRAVWREYRPGQENDKMPSPRYMAVQRLAVAEIAFRPHDEDAAKVAAHYIAEAWRWRQVAIDRGLGDPLEDMVKENDDAEGTAQ